MDNINSNKFEILNSKIAELEELNITPKQVKEDLYPYIEEIMKLDNETQSNIIKEWKYGNDFELTIKNHVNNQQLNHNVSWEESFCMTFLLFIYH